METELLNIKPSNSQKKTPYKGIKRKKNENIKPFNLMNSFEEYNKSVSPESE